MIKTISDRGPELTINPTWVFPLLSASGEDVVPCPRIGASLTCADPTTQSALLFAGASHESGHLCDMYSLSFDAQDFASWKLISPASSAPAPPCRYDHLATLVHTPREKRRPCLLVFGGSGESSLLNDLWLFDVESRTWSHVEARGSIPSPRTIQSCGVAATETKGERLYIFGGGDNGDVPVQDSNVYCLDVDSMIWIRVTDSADGGLHPSPRLGHSLSLIDGKLIIFGGMLSDGFSTNETWIFDIASRRWELVSTGQFTPLARCGHSAAIVRDQIIVFCGMMKGSGVKFISDAVAFDAVSRRWKEVDAVGLPPEGSPSGRVDHSACVVGTDGDERMVVFGGASSSGVLNELVEMRFGTVVL